MLGTLQHRRYQWLKGDAPCHAILGVERIDRLIEDLKHMLHVLGGRLESQRCEQPVSMSVRAICCNLTLGLTMVVYLSHPQILPMS